MEFDIRVIPHGHVDHEVVICEVNGVAVFVGPDMRLFTFKEFF
jgi:hypothetical protein